MKQKFQSIACQTGPTGDPECPAFVRLVHIIRHAMIEKTDRSMRSLHDLDGLERSNKQCEEEPHEEEGDENEGETLMTGELDLGIIDVIHDMNVEAPQEQMVLGSLKCPGSVMSSVST